MTFIGDDLDDVAYDFLGYANELLHNLDISDESNLVRRAIELQAFSVSLYYPRLSQLDVTRKGPTPPVGHDCGRKTARGSKASRVLCKPYTKGMLQIKQNTSSSKRIEESLGRRVGRNQILKDYLALESGGLSMLLEDPSPREYAHSLKQRLNLSERVAILIKAYLTNGDELPNTGRRPVGFQAMKDALSDPEIFDKSAKTLDNAFIDLEPTAVFHYTDMVPRMR